MLVLELIDRGGYLEEQLGGRGRLRGFKDTQMRDFMMMTCTTSYMKSWKM